MFFDPSPPPARAFRGRVLEHRKTIVVWLVRAVVVVGAVTISTLVPVQSRVATLALIGIGGLAGIQAALVLIARRRTRRLESIATEHGLSYSPRTIWAPSTTAVKGVTNPRLVDSFSRRDGDVTLSIGTLEFGCERSGVQVTERWGLIEWTFESGPLPHLFVQAVGPGSRSLPAALDSDQRRRLEGDFPRHYALYCRPGAERDALYVLTPELMAALVDRGRAASLEVSRGTLRLYSPYAFDPNDRLAWSDRAALIAGVGTKAVERVRRLGRMTDSSAAVESRPINDLGSVQAAAGAVRLRSSGRSNRSTTLVEIACVLIVAAVFLWTWTH